MGFLSRGFQCLFLFVLLAVPVSPAPAAAGDRGFAAWFSSFKSEAAARGIDPALVDRVMAGVRPRSGIISRDRSQPEFRLSLEEYVARLVNGRRVQQGRVLIRRHRRVLARVGEEYGVDPAVLVALWGIESDYGRLTGSWPVIEALATLSYDLRRRDYFTGELIAALRLVDRGMVPLSAMRGSWAGAMGPLQFMPSVFLEYGVDFDRDGRIDPWRDYGDLFASGANYLRKSGWKKGLGCLWKLRCRGGLRPPSADERRMLAFWRLCGFVPLDPWSAPRDVRTRIIAPEGREGPLFAVSGNYDVLLKWNRSHSFAIAVAELARRIGTE